jgi:hypothetical protein
MPITIKVNGLDHATFGNICCSRTNLLHLRSDQTGRAIEQGGSDPRSK